MKSQLMGRISESLKEQGITLGDTNEAKGEFKVGDKPMYKGKECEVMAVDDESGDITIKQGDEEMKVSAKDLGGKTEPTKKDIKEGAEGTYRGIAGIVCRIEEGKHFFSDGEKEVEMENLEFFVEKKACNTNEEDDVQVDDYVMVDGVGITVTAVDGDNITGKDDDDKEVKFKVADIEK